MSFTAATPFVVANFCDFHSLLLWHVGHCNNHFVAVASIKPLWNVIWSSNCDIVHSEYIPNMNEKEVRVLALQAK